MICGFLGRGWLWNACIIGIAAFTRCEIRSSGISNQLLGQPQQCKTHSRQQPPHGIPRKSLYINHVYSQRYPTKYPYKTTPENSLPEPSVQPATNHNQHRPGRDIINMSFPREKNVRCTWCITPNGHAIDISMTRPLRHRDVAFDTPRLSTGSPHEQDDSHRVLPLVHETSVLPGTPILCSRSSPLP